MTDDPATGERPCLLRAEGLTKAFAGVRALHGVSLEVRAGEVHALMGGNGAGKSTLMRILAGLERPDGGRLWVQGREVAVRNPHEASRLGIAMIHQELLPVPEMSVAENVFLGREPSLAGTGWMDRRRMHQESARLLDRLGARFTPERRMGSLTLAEMQTVEIARALAGEARLVIMDEPTSAIADAEVALLFDIIRDLKARGVAVLYITHRMEEVFQIADRVTVLRDGERVGTARAAEVTADAVIEWMVGRPLGDVFPRRESVPGGVAFEVRGLSGLGRFEDVSFSVRRREIVGLAGLLGSGRSAVLRAIYGLDGVEGGRILVGGEEVRIASPRDALGNGIALVPEDRQRDGLVPLLSVRENLTLSGLDGYGRRGWVGVAGEGAVAREWMGRLGIRAPSSEQPVRLLSGGNQQKVVLGRALMTRPRILLLDEPTRGIDVAAKAEVYRWIGELAQEGLALVLVSSELSEVLALSHRVVVIREGRVAGEVDPRQVTQAEVIRLAMPQGSGGLV